MLDNFIKSHLSRGKYSDSYRTNSVYRHKNWTPEAIAKCEAEIERQRALIYDNQPKYPLVELQGEELEFYKFITGLDIFADEDENVKIAFIFSTRQASLYWNPDCPDQTTCISELSLLLVKFKKVSDKIVALNDHIIEYGIIFDYNDDTETVSIVPRKEGGLTYFLRNKDNNLVSTCWYGFLDSGEIYPQRPLFFPLTIVMPKK
ncbi:MAG: hypothetical protein Q7U16_16900 [Agitococcus sp.]|nr:hypothetical protein [Agitococcus sp.]